jgi:hypothetical protein
MNRDAAPLYGLVGEFGDSDAAVAMARQLRDDGFRSFDVYSPVPLEEMDELLPRRPRLALALIMFAAALAGFVLAFFMQYAIAVVGYPLNIGGRPLNSWPAFIPSAWEICALSVVSASSRSTLIAACRCSIIRSSTRHASSAPRRIARSSVSRRKTRASMQTGWRRSFASIAPRISPR